MKRIVVGISFLCFIASAWWFRGRDAGKTQPFDFAASRSVLLRLVSREGTDKARSYLEKLAGSYDAGTLHELEHVYGEELYRRAGLSGITACGDRALFGCYHGFWAAAVAQEGEGIADRMDSVCREGSNRFSCIHGVGHGIAAHGGGDEAALPATLVGCNVFKTTEDRTGCLQGVFMEYFVGTMNQKVSTLSVTDDHPYGPCDRVGGEFRSACYLEVGNAWVSRGERSAARLGGLCHAIREPENREQCFRGIGQVMTGVLGFVSADITAFCRAMPEPAEQAACLTSAGRQFLMAGKNAESTALCRSLPEADLCLAELGRLADTLPFDEQTEKKNIQRLFAGKPGDLAYQEFVSRYLPFGARVHNIAHLAGTLLYEHEGNKGIVRCGDEFAYGCYHGFLAAAFSREKDSIVRIAETACGSGSPLRTGGCIHGLGHGILGLSGYSVADLETALGRCSLLATQDLQGGCQNGVFMEFNNRTMASDQVRPWDRNHPYDPCDSIRSEYQKGCYYELPSYWMTVRIGTEAAGKLCINLPDGDLRIACGRGMGREMASTGQPSVAAISSECRKAGREVMQSCLWGALEVLLSQKYPRAYELCDALPGGEKDDCRAYGKSISCTVLGTCE